MSIINLHVVFFALNLRLQLSSLINNYTTQLLILWCSGKMQKKTSSCTQIRYIMQKLPTDFFTKTSSKHKVNRCSTIFTNSINLQQYCSVQLVCTSKLSCQRWKMCRIIFGLFYAYDFAICFKTNLKLWRLIFRQLIFEPKHFIDTKMDFFMTKLVKYAQLSYQINIGQHRLGKSHFEKNSAENYKLLI